MTMGPAPMIRIAEMSVRLGLFLAREAATARLPRARRRSELQVKRSH
jgi:hypothetical protein